jgi:hypothetical protein
MTPTNTARLDEAGASLLPAAVVEMPLVGDAKGDGELLMSPPPATKYARSLEITVTDNPDCAVMPTAGAAMSDADAAATRPRATESGRFKVHAGAPLPSKEKARRVTIPSSGTFGVRRAKTASVDAVAAKKSSGLHTCQ